MSLFELFNIVLSCAKTYGYVTQNKFHIYNLRQKHYFVEMFLIILSVAMSQDWADNARSILGLEVKIDFRHIKSI